MAGPPDEPRPLTETPQQPLAPDEAPSGEALTRATAVMGIGTTLSRLTGFVRLGAMAWAIGGAESKLPDTYQLANTLPNIVYQLILGEILATVFVPVFVEYVSTKTREGTRSLASTVMLLVLGVAAVASAVAVLAAPWLINIYTFRLEGADRIAQEEVGAFFLRLFMPQMIFYAAGIVMTGLLNAHRRFAAPMFAPVLNNVIVIATFVVFRLSHGGGVPTLQSLTNGDKLLLGLGTTAGVVAMTLVLIPSILKLPYDYRFTTLDLRHPALRQVASLARYALLYVVANQIGLYVVKLLANGVQGGVVAYETSFIIYQLPYGIVAVSVFTALIPSLSEHHVRSDLESFRRDLSFGLRLTSLVMLPAAAGFVALAHPIVRVLLEHGVFSARSTDLFADTFAFMALGLWAYAAFLQLMKAFVSMQDTRTPWLVNSAGVLVNIATALPLFFALGVPGLGLSHALAYISALALAAFVIRRRISHVGGRPLLVWHLKVLAASVLTGLAARGVAELVGARVDLASLGAQVLQVSAAIVAGIAVYVGSIMALKLPELRLLFRGLSASLKQKG